MASAANALDKMCFKTFERSGDIYCLFYEYGMSLLKPGYLLSFITSNKWMRAAYGEKLRHFLSQECDTTLLIDFAGYKVFDNATVDVNILNAFKRQPQGKTLSCSIDKTIFDINKLSDYVQQLSICCDYSCYDHWVILSPIEQNIKRKIESLGTPLKDWNVQINYGIKTGFNDAFIITTEKRNEILANCKTEDEKQRSAELIRPILRGRDIKRYGYSWPGSWIIATFPSKHYDINDYPAVKEHLISFGKERLEQTGVTHIINGEKVKSRKKTNNKWFETQDSISYWEDFMKPKVVYREISDVMDACSVPSGIFINNKCYMITGEHLNFLLAYFNSQLFTKIILPIVNITGGKGVDFLSHVNSIIPSEEDSTKIFELQKEGKYEEIDRYLMNLYSLSKDEINYILTQ
jgi:adenine-specific DNA-methyltransferase